MSLGDLGIVNRGMWGLEAGPVENPISHILHGRRHSRFADGLGELGDLGTSGDFGGETSDPFAGDVGYTPPDASLPTPAPPSTIGRDISNVIGAVGADIKSLAPYLFNQGTYQVVDPRTGQLMTVVQPQGTPVAFAAGAGSGTFGLTTGSLPTTLGGMLPWLLIAGVAVVALSGRGR